MSYYRRGTVPRGTNVRRLGSIPGRIVPADPPSGFTYQGTQGGYRLVAQPYSTPSAPSPSPASIANPSLPPAPLPIYGRPSSGPIIAGTGTLNNQTGQATFAPVGFWAQFTQSSSYVPPMSSTSALAQAQATLQSNPGALTQAQWTLLQQNGIIASTLPYSSASQVATSSAPVSAPVSTDDPLCVAAGMTGGPYPNCTAAVSATSFLSTAYYGFPLWMWLAGGAVGLYAFSGSKGRRRR